MDQSPADNRLQRRTDESLRNVAEHLAEKIADAIADGEQLAPTWLDEYKAIRDERARRSKSMRDMLDTLRADLAKPSDVVDPWGAP